MNYLTISFFATLMFFTAASSAQKKTLHSLRWEVAAELPPASGQQRPLGFAGPVAGVHHDVLIVAGGANFPDSMPWQGGKKKYYDDVYVYVKNAGKIVLHKKKFKLLSNIAYSASCSTQQGIVYAGGENEKGISNKVMLLQWDAAAQNIVISKLPDLPVAVTNAAAAVHENMIYVGGGETVASASDQLYCLNLNSIAAGWKKMPSLPNPVSHAVMTVQSNGDNTCIYLAGGRKKNTNGISDLYNSLFEFDLKKDQWSVKTPLPYNLCAGTGIAIGSNYLLMLGGDKGETFHRIETSIAAINAETDEAKKQILIQQKNQLLASHPGFSKEVLVYNTKKDEWTIAGKILFNAPVTTTAFKWRNRIIIPGGEIKAGVRTHQILSAKPNFKNE